MKEFFENAVLAFQKDKDAQAVKLEKQMAKLEGKLAQKNEVLAELMEEHVKLKKSLGEI
jgi:transposase